MGLLIECPKCKMRKSIKTVNCNCGFNIKKAAHKNYWIEYYFNGKRKRERIGPSKAAAEQRLREVLKNRTEERFIDRNKNAHVTFDELANWYLEQPHVQAKKSYSRDVLSVKVLRRFFSGKTMRDITINQVKTYRGKRLEEESYRKQKTRPATINREIACLRYMLNLAEQEGKIETVTFKGLKALKEHNKRNRLLSHDEYNRLISHCPRHTAQIVKMAYLTAMRQSEILKLTWDRIDLRSGVVRLEPEDTKTDEQRTVPLHPELVVMIKSMPRTIHGRIFTIDGKPLTDIKRSFKTACRNSGIKDLRFHDLRHACINNWRLEGHDFFRIMKASGHKTMEVFKRYNTITDEEVKALVSNGEDTYMDTSRQKDPCEFVTTA